MPDEKRVEAILTWRVPAEDDPSTGPGLERVESKGTVHELRFGNARLLGVRLDPDDASSEHSLADLTRWTAPPSPRWRRVTVELLLDDDSWISKAPGQNEIWRIRDVKA